MQFTKWGSSAALYHGQLGGGAVLGNVISKEAEKTMDTGQPNCKRTRTNFIRIMSNSVENTYIKKNDRTDLKESRIA